MIPVNEKLAIMRESERMNRKEFSDLTGVPYSSLELREGRKRYGHTGGDEDFESSSVQKYTMWFMTETISPEAGQIAPALAHFGQQTTTSPHSDQKTG